MEQFGLNVPKKKRRVYYEKVKHRETRRDLEKKRAEVELELTQLKEEHSYDIEKEKIKAETEKAKIEAESKMTADQLLGRNIAQMDAAAQAKFAESFSHLNEVEMTKANAEEREKLYQQMLQMAEANNINMREVQSANSNQQMDMMQQILAAFAQISMTQNANQQGCESIASAHG